MSEKSNFHVRNGRVTRTRYCRSVWSVTKFLLLGVAALGLSGKFAVDTYELGASEPTPLDIVLSRDFNEKNITYFVTLLVGSTMSLALGLLALNLIIEAFHAQPVEVESSIEELQQWLSTEKSDVAG